MHAKWANIFAHTHSRNPSRETIKRRYAIMLIENSNCAEQSLSPHLSWVKRIKMQRRRPWASLMHAERTSKQFPPIIAWPLVGVPKGSPFRVWPRCALFCWWRCWDEWAARMSHGPEINARRTCAFKMRSIVLCRAREKSGGGVTDCRSALFAAAESTFSFPCDPLTSLSRRTVYCCWLRYTFMLFLSRTHSLSRPVMHVFVSPCTMNSLPPTPSIVK